MKVLDNSAERDDTGAIPPPRLLLHWKGGTVAGPEPSALEVTPEWAKPIVAAALKLQCERK